MRNTDEIKSEYKECLEMTSELNRKHKRPVQFARGFTTGLGWAAGLTFKQALSDVDEIIDTGECTRLNGNGFQYVHEVEPEAGQQYQIIDTWESRRKNNFLKVSLSAKEIIKMLAIVGGTVATCFLIVFSYLAGMMFGVLVLVGMIVFILLIGKVVD